VDLTQHEIPDKGIDLLQELGIVGKTSLVLILLEELGRRCAVAPLIYREEAVAAPILYYTGGIVLEAT
jgi:hypothetical protein